MPDDERVEDAGLFENLNLGLNPKAPNLSQVTHTYEHSIDQFTHARYPWSDRKESIVVGKDILEILSSAMYVDPLTIYREYVQNAADAIDEARNKRIVPPE